MRFVLLPALAIILAIVAAPVAAEMPPSGSAFRDCPDCPEMVVVPAGRFVMGSPDWEEGRNETEGPQHAVAIAGFALGRYEVTRGEFAVFAADRNFRAEGCWAGRHDAFDWEPLADWREPLFQQTDAHPVVCVNWDDAQAYVAWLALRADRPYRLPSEAEWEYAVRGGTTTTRYWGHSGGVVCDYANGKPGVSSAQMPPDALAVCYDATIYTAPVGQFIGNGFDLHDLLGNVWEWTADCFSQNYLGAPTDGSAWRIGDCERPVIRGGAWSSGPMGLRSAFRSRVRADDRSSIIGFRVALSLEP